VTGTLTVSSWQIDQPLSGPESKLVHDPVETSSPL